MSQSQQRWRGSVWGEDQRVGLGLWLVCLRLEQTGNTAAFAAGSGAGGVRATHANAVLPPFTGCSDCTNICVQNSNCQTTGTIKDSTVSSELPCRILTFW